MKKRLKIVIVFILILIFGISIGIIIRQDKTTWKFVKNQIKKTYVKFDDTIDTNWDKDFNIVEIKSKLDDNVQKAYFYKSKSTSPKPLIISLHTWSGYYNQNDELANICKQKK